MDINILCVYIGEKHLRVCKNGKKCAWGTCNTDSRCPGRMGDGIYFIQCPKPHQNRAECP